MVTSSRAKCAGGQDASHLPCAKWPTANNGRQRALLQKTFLGAGETAFVGAGVIPAPRSYKSSL